MHSGDLIRTLGSRSYFRDGDRGSIRAEDDLRANEAVKLLEDALFDLQILKDRLNDEISIRNILDSGCPLDFAQQLVLLFLSDFSPLDSLGQKSLNGGHSLFYKLIGHILHHHGTSALSRNLGDAAAHSTCPYHTDFLNVHLNTPIRFLLFSQWSLS